MLGPQSANSYRRDTDPADAALGAGDDPATLDMLSTAGLDLIVRGFAHTAGATAGLMAVSDTAGKLVRVLSAITQAPSSTPNSGPEMWPLASTPIGVPMCLTGRSSAPGTLSECVEVQTGTVGAG